VLFDRDVELILTGDELAKHEAAESVIVITLPIEKTTSKEIWIEELEPLAGLQPTSRLLLGHVLHAVCAEERVDCCAGRFETDGSFLGLARRDRQDGDEDENKQTHPAVIAPFLETV
jgi:hypothetical protein